MNSARTYAKIDIPVYLVFIIFICAQVALGGGRIVSWGSGPIGDDLKTEMSAVSAGYIHSLALTTSGVIVAWGNNDQGQLDIPEDDNRAIAAISAGGFHNLALSKKGEVISWGLNTDGQATVPSHVSRSCIAVDAGMFHSMALHKSGYVMSWGYNEFGQANAPWGLWNVTDISAGAMHSLALRSDGVVFVWGDNSFDQQVIPDEAQNNVTSISAGYFHSLALTRDGQVIAWGDNTYGQCTIPVEAQNNIIAISAGQTHSMALRSDGTLVMWGGSIGVPQASEATSELHLTAISAGGYHSIGLIPATEDENGNAIPDWWEYQYGLTDSLGEHSDFDKDGFSDLDEFLSDTNPTDKQSNFSIHIVHGEDDSCEVLYGPISIERTYTVEEVTDMNANQWKSVSGGSTHLLESSSGDKMSRMTIESTSTTTYETKIFRVIINTP